MRLGIDIGGTKILGGLIDHSGQTVDYFRADSKKFQNPRALVSVLCEDIARLLDKNHIGKDEIDHFGVGIPGTANWKTGQVVYSPNLFGESVPLSDYIEEELGIRPTVVQDSWAAAYAEYFFGQKKTYEDMLCVTLGTGIGCGVIQNSKVYSGMLHTAGEIGHVSIDMNGRPCSCGRRGCLETYASGTGIYEQAKERFPEKLVGRKCGAEAVFELAYGGDREALALIEECVDRLAFGLGTLVNVLACSNIFISGGLSVHNDLIIKPLSAAIAKYGYPAWSHHVTPMVQRAALGEEAPMIGAAFLTAENIV